MTSKIQRRKLYFAHAYSYAAAITQRLHSESGQAELLDWIDETSQNFRTSVVNPQKNTLLHSLIHDLAFFDREHDITHWYLDTLDQFFADHDEIIPKKLRKNTDGNHDKLCTRLEQPIAKLVQGAFYIIFGDRNALLLFNEMISKKIKQLAPVDVPEMTRPGILRRPSYIPVWLKKAVFHRDKGRCQMCQRDLTGLVNPVSDAEYDHIWPLAKSGTNDATNFQLLCRRCNSKKSGDDGVTSNEYYMYW